MANPIPISPDSPKLIDAALQGLTTDLAARLSWLTVYGKAQRLKETVNGSSFYFPGIAAAENQYLKLLPDTTLGSYGFFLFRDPYNLDGGPGGALVSTSGSLVIFFDFRDVYPANHTTRTTENVKFDVLRALRIAARPYIRLQVESIEEEVENVFNGFTTSKIDSGLLLRPYGCLKFNFAAHFNELTIC